MNKSIDNLELKKLQRKLISLGTGLTIFSIAVSYFKQEYWLWPLPLALLLISFGLVAPWKLNFIIKGLDRGILYFRKSLFFLLFFVFITPSSFILRLIRPSVISLNISPLQKSYWEELKDSEEYSNDLNKQY